MGPIEYTGLSKGTDQIMKATKIYILVLFSILVLGSCNETGSKGDKKPDDEVSGKINISVDESLKPFADSEVKTFMRFTKERTL